MISVIAVLGFNISLVVGGILEAVERHLAFIFLTHKVLHIEQFPSLKGVDGRITLVLSIIPAIDLAFHLGCDWAAWRVSSVLSITVD